MSITANLVGGIIGVGLGVFFVIPLLVLVTGYGLAGVLKVLKSIIS